MNAGEDLDTLVSDQLMNGIKRPYSRDISCAWQLVEVCKEEGILIKIECLLDTYRVSWYYEDIYASKPEEGICKLALLAKLDV